MTIRELQSQNRVQIPVGRVLLDGELHIPKGSQGIVVFAFGLHNHYVAKVIQDAGLATLLVDLLTSDEGRYTRHLRFDVNMLAQRLLAATDWLEKQPEARELSIGYLGASTGAAAALIAAAERPATVSAIVSRGGRPDLAGDALKRVHAPTLLIVGGDDRSVLNLNHLAMQNLTCPLQLEIVPGATHIFEEPGKLEEVACLARNWFLLHLTSSAEDVPNQSGSNARSGPSR